MIPLRKLNFLYIPQKLFCLLILSLCGMSLKAQPPLFKTPAYINNYSEIAIEQMVEYKIPASVILAQAIFESNSGTSSLAQRSNNHFGIKCHAGWSGDTIVKTDDELNECFRSYENVEVSYRDHSLFLVKRARYAALFNIPITDYKSWCKGLKAAGYATHGTYAEDLISVIEQNRLFEFDRIEQMETIVFAQKIKGEIKETGPIEFKDLATFLATGLLDKNEEQFTMEELKWFFAQNEAQETEPPVMAKAINIDYYDKAERSEY
jgi:hypothetical protein